MSFSFNKNKICSTNSFKFELYSCDKETVSIKQSNNSKQKFSIKNIN